MLFPVLVSFLVVRRMFGWHAGIMSALLLSGASYYLFWGGYPVAQTFAIALYAGALLEVSRLASSAPRDPRRISIMVVFMTSLVFVHPYTAVVLGVTIFGILAWTTIANGLDRPLTVRPRLGQVMLIYLLILLAQWMFYSFRLSTAVGFAQQYVQAIAALDRFPSTRFDLLPLSLILLNTVGDALIIFLAAVGGLRILERTRRDASRAFLGASFILLGTIGGGTLLRLPYLFPQRLYVFLLLAGLIPLSSYAISGSEATLVLGPPAVTSLKRCALVAVLVGVVIMSSSASSIAGFDTSPLYQSQPYLKLYDTYQERDAAAWVCENVVAPNVNVSRGYSPFSSARILVCVTQREATYGFVPVSRQGSLDVNAFRPGSVVVVSMSDVVFGYSLGVATNQLYGDDVVARLDSSEYSKLIGLDRIYDNGWVQAFSDAPMYP
jgi:hypothetical protein